MRLDINITFTPLVVRIENTAPADLAQIKTQLTTILMKLDTLEAEVAQTATVQQSAIVLLQGLKAKLDEAGTDEVKLKALSDSLSESTDALAAAVVANTPTPPPAEG